MAHDPSATSPFPRQTPSSEPKGWELETGNAHIRPSKTKDQANSLTRATRAVNRTSVPLLPRRLDRTITGTRRYVRGRAAANWGSVDGDRSPRPAANELRGWPPFQLGQLCSPPDRQGVVSYGGLLMLRILTPTGGRGRRALPGAVLTAVLLALLVAVPVQA